MTANVGAADVGVGLDVPSVAVEPHDTDGRLLRLQTEQTSHTSVSDRLLVADGLSLHLEILAASHRVGLSDGDLLVHETVACAPGTAAVVNTDQLPGQHRWTVGHWNLDFSSALAFGPEAIEQASAVLSNLSVEDADNSLLRRFPGHPLALTALNADLTRADQVSWRSWHLYPGTDPHVVTTVTQATRQERRP